jgi:hypothetical protein
MWINPAHSLLSASQKLCEYAKLWIVSTNFTVTLWISMFFEPLIPFRWQEAHEPVVTSDVSRSSSQEVFDLYTSVLMVAISGIAYRIFSWPNLQMLNLQAATFLVTCIVKHIIGDYAVVKWCEHRARQCIQRCPYLQLICTVVAQLFFAVFPPLAVACAISGAILSGFTVQAALHHSAVQCRRR